MLPMQWAVYKGVTGKFGAIQITPQAPHHYKGKEKSFNEKDKDGESIFEVVDGRRKLKEGWSSRDGCLFLNIASAKDKNVYDWENKIVFALSVSDMGQILYFLTMGCDPKGNESLSLMHDPGAKSESQGAVKKFMRLYSPKGVAKGCMVTMTQQSGGQERKHEVPLDGAEAMTLRSLLQAAIPQALNW